MALVLASYMWGEKSAQHDTSDVDTPPTTGGYRHFDHWRFHEYVMTPRAHKFLLLDLIILVVVIMVVYYFTVGGGKKSKSMHDGHHMKSH